MTTTAIADSFHYSSTHLVHPDNQLSIRQFMLLGVQSECCRWWWWWWHQGITGVCLHDPWYSWDDGSWCASSCFLWAVTIPSVYWCITVLWTSYVLLLLWLGWPQWTDSAQQFNTCYKWRLLFSGMISVNLYQIPWYHMQKDTVRTSNIA
jgi:hypothetical protein